MKLYALAVYAFLYLPIGIIALFFLLGRPLGLVDAGVLAALVASTWHALRTRLESSTEYISRPSASASGIRMADFYSATVR
ncbi:hypothetical protein [Antarcticimicrobium sediminis]|uniref:hypothetical protein n=1 Tax=Antarcticimicrobium sediminis TaxID=2546227 RepID=UPI001FE07E00|nr:hypothetical protein [Antarcticimicrobium sediminis]